MYCCADFHFILFYLLALRDAFSKVKATNTHTEYVITIALPVLQW